ncbi:MAG: YkgJ family cysteine cluster protein [Nitrospirae bacterium]|nr:YkgJ family cysteine cluster protein [Nitrospirota bacterium]
MKTVRADPPLLQLVPSELCLKCDICCRFPEADTPLAPYFTPAEVKNAVVAGLPPEFFNGERSGRIRLIPFPDEIESPGHQGGCLCPAFDPLTHKCSIYEVRPFDCQIYPFVLMKKNESVAVGIDTKCPYIQEASNSPAIRKYGEGLIQILESPRIQSMLKKNQELIGPFQEDVIVLKVLEGVS